MQEKSTLLKLSGTAGCGDCRPDAWNHPRHSGSSSGLERIPVVLIDTAGLRDSTTGGLDPVEVEGMRRAKAAENGRPAGGSDRGSDSSPADENLQTWITAADLIVRSKM